MRKSILDPQTVSGRNLTPNQSKVQDAWLYIEQLADVEITSEDPLFPIEAALNGTESTGWRASCKGPQFIRLNFEKPVDIRRILLRFLEASANRSQEFAIYARSKGSEMREVVRQQFTFSTDGSTEETEDFTVSLHAVTVFELRIDPDRAHDPTHSQHFACLQSLQLA